MGQLYRTDKEKNVKERRKEKKSCCLYRQNMTFLVGFAACKKIETSV
jgi:hypothetical protein